MQKIAQLLSNPAWWKAWLVALFQARAGVHLNQHGVLKQQGKQSHRQV